MTLDTRRLGVGISAAGVVLLLTLRLWASPVALVITGRRSVSAVAFLAIPAILAIIGAGIVLFLWGEEIEGWLA